MSDEDEADPIPGSDSDLLHCLSEKSKGPENSDTGTEEFEEAPTQSEQEPLDLSSDESQKAWTYDQGGDQKYEKKSEKPYKPKVKIKTLTIDGQLVYFCKICDKIFTRRKDKLNHELAHSGESVLTCTECGKEYLHESSLASHMRTHAGDPLYMCDLCPKMFAQSHHLKTHILSHSDPTNFTCKTCYKEFPTAADLNHHNRLQIKQEMTQFWCKMCKVYFCRSHNLLCEKRIHAFCCSACSELFYTQKKLKIHMKKFSHFSEEKPKTIEPLQEHELYPDKVPENLRKFQTQKENDLMKNPSQTNHHGKRQNENTENEIPAKRFKLSSRKMFLEDNHSSTSLQDSAPEIRTEVEIDLKSPTKHRKGKPYCKRCNKSFKDSANLERHKALVHEDKQEPFLCDICNMGFSSKDKLEHHGFKHTGERMHTCPMCGEEFPHSLQLTKHLRTHAGDHPYKCSQCGKSFKLKIQLIHHVRLHIPQDSNTCEKCQAKFSTKAQLQDHVSQVHEDIESFQCHLCNKSFSFRYKLLNHLRLHTNVKCFQCYICHKTFATKHYLQRHLQVHVKQGMDVDVQNIIIDEDSKSELESIREQITKDNFQNKEGFHNHPNLDSLEDEHLRKPFPGLKKSISNTEQGNKLKSNLDFDSNGCESKLENPCSEIKVEIDEHTDSASEHSFCSSFTRDSERSDQYKFSSDESYSFKTAMAKERRRLRRKCRQAREIPVKTDIIPKSENLNESGNLVEEDDVTDMMVELNAVKSEIDNLTTVFVNLTQMKSISSSKHGESDIKVMDLPDKSVDSEPSASVINAVAPQVDTFVKDEVKESSTDVMLNNQTDQNKEDGDKIDDKEKASPPVVTSKTHMFEIDTDQFLNGDFELLHDGGLKGVTNETSKMIPNGSNVNTSIPSGADLPESENFSSLTVNMEKPHFNTESKGTNSISTLDRLKAAFENSCKYLPLPENTSTLSQIQLHPHDSHSKEENQESTDMKKQQSKTKTLQNSFIENSNNQSVSISPANKVSLLPSLNHQIKLITDNEHLEIAVNQYANFPDVSKSRIFQNELNTSHKKSPDNNKSQVFPNRKSVNQQKSSLSFGLNHFISSSSGLNTSQTSNVTSFDHNNSSLTLCPSQDFMAGYSASQSLPMLGLSSSLCQPSTYAVHAGIGPLQTPGIHSHGSSSTAIYPTNPSHTPVSMQSTCPPNDSLNVHVRYGATISDDGDSNRTATVNPIFSTSLPNATDLLNPTSASTSIMDDLNCGQQNRPVNASLWSSTDSSSCPLNSSSIFDTSNPVLRDMNMMDLVSPSYSGSSAVSIQPHVDVVGLVPTSNSYSQPHIDFIRQQNAEAQFRQTLMTVVEAHNIGSQSHTPLVPMGNASFGINMGNAGNTINGQVNSGLMASNVAMNYGHLDSSMLNLSLIGNVGGDFVQMRAMYESVSRENMITNFACGIPQQPLNIGPLGASLPISATSNFPINTGFSGLGAMPSCNMGIPISLGSSSFFGGPDLNSGNFSAFTHTNTISGVPLNISNPHIINNVNANFTPFASSGLQDSLRNILAPAGLNLSNPTINPQNSALLLTNSLGFMNTFNSGLFPNF